MKKGKSIKKLSYFKQIFLSQNKKCQRETCPPCPTIQHAEQSTSFISAGWFDASTHILSHPWSLNSVILLSGDRDKMVHANELTKVMLYASKTGSQTSSEWFRESKKWRSSEVAGIWKHTVLNVSPWKYVCVLVYWPVCDTTLLWKEIRAINMEK